MKARGAKHLQVMRDQINHIELMEARYKRLQDIYEIKHPWKFKLFGGCIFHKWDNARAATRQCLECGVIQVESHL